MGQYHAVGSLDKVEALYSHEMGEGLKLLEQGCGGFGGTTTGLALFIAPGGRWHGDRIAVVGDYAEVGDLPDGCPCAKDPSAIYAAINDFAVTEEAKRIVGEAFGISYVREGRYNLLRVQLDDPDLRERLKKLSSNTENDKNFGPLYVVNLDTGQYLDPRKFGAGRNLAAIALRQCGVMLATFILLAVSNNRGGGDFHSDASFIGSWGGDRVVLGPIVDGAIDISDLVKREIKRVEGAFILKYDPLAWRLGSIPPWLAKDPELAS